MTTYLWTLKGPSISWIKIIYTMDSCYGWIGILSFQFQIKSINLTRIYQTVITTSVFRLDIFIVTLPSSSPPTPPRRLTPWQSNGNNSRSSIFAERLSTVFTLSDLLSFECPAVAASKHFLEGQKMRGRPQSVVTWLAGREEHERLTIVTTVTTLTTVTTEGPAPALYKTGR